MFFKPKWNKWVKKHALKTDFVPHFERQFFNYFIGARALDVSKLLSTGYKFKFPSFPDEFPNVVTWYAKNKWIPKFLIKYLSGAYKDRARVLNQTKLRLGRDPRNDITFDPLKDLGVSAFHAEIEFKDDKVYFKDLGSTNGCFIDDKQVTEAELSDGIIIRLGRKGPKIQVFFSINNENENNKNVLLTDFNNVF